MLMKSSQKTQPSQLKKKNTAGEIQKIIRGVVFLAGRMPALLA